MKFLLISLLLLTSCWLNEQEIMTPSEIDLKLSEEWIYATDVSRLKYNGEILSTLPGFEQLVMELIIPNSGGIHYKRHCVYYTVRYKEKISNLKVVESKNLDRCPDFSSSENVFLTRDGVDKLKVTIANFKLSLEFEIASEKTKIEIPMPNLVTGVVHEKYQALKEISMKSGLKLLRLSEDSFDFANNKYLGKLSDRFNRGTAIRCHQVNKNCETVGENRCNDCRYGWYEVVDFQCPQGGSKFCGQNHCGEKNEPACPRGIKVVDQSDAGICQSDLVPVENADKILICQ